MPMVRGSPNPKHYGLPSRLMKARKQAGLTRTALAEKIGGGQTAALYIETGQRIPTIGTVARLAAALSVSAAWLAYGIGEPHSEASPVDCSSMGARLHAVRIERGHTKASLARLAVLNPGTIGGIERGGQAGIDTIERLAKELRISPAWLAYGAGERELAPRRRSRPAATI